MAQENRFPDPESEADAAYYSSELEAARAEITRLEKQSVILRVTAKCHEHWQEKCAASQAESARLRDYLGRMYASPLVLEALAAPSDTSALEAIVAKAGEKMREAAIGTIKWPHDHQTLRAAIRALPNVTLEDLK